MNSQQKHLQEAISFHQAGHLNDASSIYDEILNENPEDPNALHLRGLVWFQLGDYSKAIELIEHAIERQPHVPSFHTHLGLAYKAIGELEKAIVNFENAIEWDPDCLDAINNLGNTLRRMDRHQEAIIRFQEVIERDPNFIEAYINLGNAYRELGKVEEAITWYEKAAEINPDHAVTFNNLGHAVYLAQNKEKAADFFEKAIQIDQGFADPHNNLANILVEQGAHESAIIHYREALKIDPNYPAPKRGLVELLKHQTLSEYQPWLDDFLCAAYEENIVSHQELSRITAQHLLAKQEASDNDKLLSSKEALNAWLSDPLLLCFLRKSINVHPQFELLLTELRCDFLLEYKNNIDCPAEHKVFLEALSLQAFHNDYVFSVNANESTIMAGILESIKNDFSQGKVTPMTEQHLLLVSLYQPLSSIHQAIALSELPNTQFSSSFTALLKETLFTTLEEKSLKSSIPAFSEPSDAVLLAVKHHYENYPYPRWISLPKLESFPFAQRLHQRFPDIELPQASTDGVHLLVAGCGTGKHPIQTALSYSDVDIKAFDLSMPSLCYGKRMAKKYQVEHLEFLQGDVLDVQQLNQNFHLIECVGVLHHMTDPFKGWEALSQMLLPKGLMRIGLYSKLGRAVVHRAHQHIEATSVTAADDSIRAFRAEVLSGIHTSLNELLFTRDFYNLNECRDYLFHVHEHEFSLDIIAFYLSELGLEFLGFQASPAVFNRYAEIYPDDKKMRNLKNWETFEEKYPSTFNDLYHFWCQKKP